MVGASCIDNTMGCNCRQKSSRTTIATKVGSTPLRGACEAVEQAGIKLNVMVQNDGLYIAAPIGSTSLDANMFLNSINCKGSTASLVRSLCVEIAVLFSDPAKKQKFMAKLPFHTLKLHYLQELIRGI